MKQISRRMMRFPANKNPVCQLNRRKKITECSISISLPFFCLFFLVIVFFLYFYISFSHRKLLHCPLPDSFSSVERGTYKILFIYISPYIPHSFPSSLFVLLSYCPWDFL